MPDLNMRIPDGTAVEEAVVASGAAGGVVADCDFS